jgi:hypothetical protein
LAARTRSRLAPQALALQHSPFFFRRLTAEESTIMHVYSDSRTKELY